jgi:hypothetical protein
MGKSLGRILLVLAAVCALSCGQGGKAPAAAAAAPQKEDPPLRDAAGKTVLVRQVYTEDTWNEISGTIKENELRGTRFLIPVPGKSKLYTYFMNLNAYPDHDAVLREFFSDEFAGITYNQYVEKAIDPAQRVFFSGNITERRDSAGRRIFSYTIWHHVSDPKKTLTLAQIAEIHAALKSLFTIGELQYDPFSKNQRDAMAGWGATPFPVFTQDELLNGYEGYTFTEAYGTLRFLTLADYQNGVITGNVDYRDIIVIDAAPFDVVPVVSGIVTGTRQGELSHLNVRFANRHIVNCFIADPKTSLSKWDGKLVHLVINKDGWDIKPATEADAAKWWTGLKPRAVSVVSADMEYESLADVTLIPTGTGVERDAAVRRYGAKAANLAILYRLIDTKYRQAAFAIPATWYFDFMQRNGWDMTLDGRAGHHSFQETVDSWLKEDRFINDGGYRAQKLALLQDAMTRAEVDPELLALIRAQVRGVFGNEKAMLRLRSSSNAEDSIQFSGAGLYDSKTACIADDFDGDELGPSRGDASEPKEKTVAQALKDVWASLWNERAVEERYWYSMDQSRVGMAILVNERTKDEKTNMVVFTGDPGARDDRFLFNAQAGDVDVVKSYGGVYPEKAYAAVSEGKVTGIQRVAFSNIAKYDLYLLSRDQINEISAVLWKVAGDFPVDFIIPEGCVLLWDTEWKITRNNRVIVKQIRPFLRDDSQLTALR